MKMATAIEAVGTGRRKRDVRHLDGGVGAPPHQVLKAALMGVVGRGLGAVVD